MDIIKKYVQYAISSYKDVYSTNSYHNVTKIDKDNVFVRLHKPTNIKDEMIISIRGTDELKDWKHNVLRWQTDFIGESRVHRGFLEHLNDVYEEIEMHTNYYNDITIVGHSLGGAVSLLLGSKLAGRNTYKKYKVITYGCPRVGDIKFKELCESLSNLQCYRAHINHDIITKMPYFGYYHTGESVNIQNKKYRCLRMKTVHSIDTYKELLDELDL